MQFLRKLYLDLKVRGFDNKVFGVFAYKSKERV